MGGRREPNEYDASAYGAASSLVIVAVWVYYSAQILLFGAEFTKVWTRRRRGGAIPEKTAVPRSSRRAGFGATACGIGCPSLRPARWASGPWVGVQRALLAHPDGMLRVGERALLHPTFSECDSLGIEDERRLQEPGLKRLERERLAPRSFLMKATESCP